MKERADTKWVCKDCMNAKGWKWPEKAVTTIAGLCGHCERKDEAFLYPVFELETQNWDHVPWG